MFIIYSVIFGLILGYITKGSLKNIIQRSLYWRWLALTAFIIQILIFSDLPLFSSLPHVIVVIFHYVSYLCLLIFIIRNIKNFGISFVGLGIFFNMLVIFINGGHMPTIPQNLKNTSVGKSAEAINQGEAVHNSAKMTSDTLLPWLGDVFYLPSWVPFSNVFSIGDVLIAVGICVYIVMNMHPARKKGHSLEDPLT
jgi:hypothetical protein